MAPPVGGDVWLLGLVACSHRLPAVPGPLMAASPHARSHSHLSTLTMGPRRPGGPSPEPGRPGHAAPAHCRGAASVSSRAPSRGRRCAPPALVGALPARAPTAGMRELGRAGMLSVGKVVVGKSLAPLGVRGPRARTGRRSRARRVALSGTYSDQPHAPKVDDRPHAHVLVRVNKRSFFWH